MAVIVIFISYLITLFLFLLRGDKIRESVLKSFLVLFLKVLLINELLSLFDWIDFSALLITWLIVVGCEIYLLVSLLKKNTRKAIFQEFLSLLRSLISNRLYLTIISLIFFILLVTLFIALVSPPNNFDSMTYHMPRVSHWIQNRSIDFFTTSNSRQNLSMPMAEYVILHFQVLSKSDRFANIVQWISFVMIINLVSLIAKEMRLDNRSQLFSGLLAAVLPMGILQSSTTQNDLVVAVFCLGFLYFLILLERKLTTENFLLAGFSMGLALLSKGTGYIFCAAIGTVYGIFRLINSKRGTIVKNIFVLTGIAGIALIINFGFYSRIILDSSDQFLSENQQIVVNHVSVLNTGSNLVRNGAIHLATLNKDLNQNIENMVADVLGDEQNNPNTTFSEWEFSIDFNINENLSGNFIHFILIFIGILIGPWILYKDKQRFVLWLVLILNLVLFNMLLKWQPWSTRLQTPIFFIGVIVVGFYLDKIIRKNWVLFSFSLLLVALSLPYLFLSTTRPVLPIFPRKSALKTTKPFRYTRNKIDKYLRKNPDLDEIIAPIKLNFQTDQSVILTERSKLYFLASKRRYDDYVEAVDIVEALDVDDIGLVMHPNHWEYPFWVLSNTHAGQGDLTFRHLFSDQTENGWILEGDEKPPVILSTHTHNLPFLDTAYKMIYDSPSVKVFYLE